MIFFAGSYIIYTNLTYNSFENLKNKKNVAVNFQNLPEVILPNKENYTGYQYELVKTFLNSLGNIELNIRNITYDINIYYTTNVCTNCQVVNEEDLLLITNTNSVENKDIEVIQALKKIDLRYFDLESFEIIYTDSSIDEMIYNINDNLITNTIVTRSTYLFYKKYFPSLRIRKNLGKVSLVWNFPGDDGSISENVKSFLQTDSTKNFIIALEKKYFSKNSISSYIFIGSRVFISDMLTKLPIYEALFKEASDAYNLDWKLLASISYQESKWDNNAVSPTGVKGLMMLTKSTAKMLNVNRLIPNESIFGGAQYFNGLLKRYSKYSHTAKTNLALASYNAGPNHINDILLLAEKNGDDIENWGTLKNYLYKLNQKKYYKDMKYGYARGWEAVQYIENVKQYYDIITFLEDKDKDYNNKIFNEVPNTL